MVEKSSEDIRVLHISGQFMFTVSGNKLLLRRLSAKLNMKGSLY